MSQWPEVRLGELAVFRNGLNFNASFRGPGVGVVGIPDFHDKSFVEYDGLEEVQPDVVTSDDALLHQGDIVFVRSNGNRQLIGRSLLVREEPPRPTSHSGFTIRLRFTDERADPLFFAYLLRSDTFRRRMSSQGGGTSINNLNQGILSRLEVPLPDQWNQQRIASILGAYDDLIEVNRRRVAVLEEMARGLFEEWFVRFRFPGHENVPIVDTSNGPLPEGWEWGRFSQLAPEVRETLSPSSVDPETPYLGLEHFPRRSTTLNDRGTASDVDSTKARFHRGDILFGKIRPYFHKVVWAPFDGIASTDAIIWRPDPRFAARALLLASSDAFVAHSVQTSNGTKMPRANTKVLAGYPCVMPTHDVSQMFEALVGPSVELAAYLQEANERLGASRDLLLPRLISGQLSVEVAERQLEDAA
ncbi:type I restriction enzyme, S subunit [Altererythrobacter xiamenensis]|uniref:Type I restriction enzyme, S subunit n=1 Tax=Altererythrobacter xiamenensis TaxID=1316679 RepID=A0A1Y6F3K4_9SPHN|nr:restriction endonuclease subunit S [Altererythrobacter xiamenensis]SMQ69498.1 type I restriction enzyme, S subunit [Altererythrobacter xiamenensis]